jgi:hypothetical protein
VHGSEHSLCGAAVNEEFRIEVGGPQFCDSKQASRSQ